MLTVTRRLREQVKIGEATVTILRDGKNIRLGIDAPRHVPVVRGELLLPANPSQEPCDAAGHVEPTDGKPTGDAAKRVRASGKA